MDPERRKRIERNIFPGARGSIPSWDEFRWHSHAESPRSSQALAIDVFGQLKATDPSSRNAVLGSLADHLGLPPDGPWEVEVEWNDPHNRLREIKTLTQVDAMARSPHSLILFECKFTEPGGGSCSQPKPLKKGKHKGLPQCDGSYRLQTNPANGRRAHCALSAKGIRYWEAIPQVFQIPGDRDHLPCPFAGSWFQWMRNIVLAREGAGKERKAGFLLVYAEAPELHVAQMVRGPDWSSFLGLVRPDTVKADSISYQDLLELGRDSLQEADLPAQVWNSLDEWVRSKIRAAARPAGKS